MELIIYGIAAYLLYKITAAVLSLVGRLLAYVIKVFFYSLLLFWGASLVMGISFWQAIEVLVHWILSF